MVKYTSKTHETGYCSLKMRSRCSKPAAAASQHSNYFFHFRCSQPHIQVLTSETDTRACADVYNDGCPLSLLILDGAHCSRLWWKTSGEILFFLLSPSHPPCSHLTCSSSLLLQSRFSFFTSLLVFFCCSAVSFFRYTSSTLCYAAPLLPATKVVNANDRRC